MEHSNFMPVQSEDSGNRASLRHLLSTEHDEDEQHTPTSTTPKQSGGRHHPRDSSPQTDANRKQPPAAMTTTTRRNKAGNVSSVYSGNRISFLKKDDGEPFWRKDIQYLFLRLVFLDQHKVFTKASDGTTGHTFAEVYIDAMAKSSKCSQILKDKLLNDTSSAIDMAMICLLVNVGRMNTTLNFFPEMRARVRTYHSIPSLQARQGVQAYKQLQDGPRLKSILKGATEDSQQPGTIDEIMAHAKPRTNPVNLIFVLSQYAPKISEMHFFPPRDFFDIFIRTTLSSRSRATAFLWMIWWYLESDFGSEDALNNPFGPGQAGEDDGVPIKVPPFDILSEEEALQENVDTPDEVAFGHAKKLEREAILANDMPPTATAPKRGNRTPLMDQQHNYRFRVSPYGSSASGSDAGSRGRASPSPPPRDSRFEGPIDGHGHRGRLEGDWTQSPALAPLRPAGGFHPSPEVSAVAPTHARLTTQTSDHHRALPPNVPVRHKGVGRGNYPRKPKEPPLQPFEQVHRHALQSHPLAAYQHPHVVAETPDVQHGRHMSSLFNAPVLTSNLPPLTARIVPNNDVMESYWASVNGSRVDTPPASREAGTTHGGSTKRRNPSAHQQAIERSRRERVNYLLFHNMRTLQRAQRRQYERRGPLADPWINSCALPSGWDSEDEEVQGKIGGVSLIRSEEVAAAEEDDDVGAKANEWARRFRKVGRQMGAGALIDRDRNLLQSKGRRNLFKHEEESMLIDDGLESSPLPDQPAVVAEAAEESTIKEKKKKPPYKRRSVKEKKVEDDETGAPVPSATKRRGTKRTVDGKTKVPAGAAIKTEPPASGRKAKSGGRARVSAKAKGKQQTVVAADDVLGKVEDEEMDEMDRELLAEIGGGEESPPGSEDGDRDEEMQDEAPAAGTPDVVMVD